MIIGEKFVSANEEETFKYAKNLAKQLKKGDFIALYGDLGAGKTAFTKGIAKGINIDEEILSPTYTFLRIYEGLLRLYHFDVYRITDIDELEHIDFAEYATGDGLCICEWANLITEALPKNRYDINIAYLDNKKREITVKKIGE